MNYKIVNMRSTHYVAHTDNAFNLLIFNFSCFALFCTEKNWLLPRQNVSYIIE
jgi:hypothetical protein